MSNPPIHIDGQLLKRLHEYLGVAQDAARIGAHDLEEEGIWIDGWTTLVKSMLNVQMQVKKLVAPTHPIHKIDMLQLSPDGKPVILRGNREATKSALKKTISKKSKKTE